MKNIEETRRDFLADLISRDNLHNGYYEKLGVANKIKSAMDKNSFSNNLWSLEKLQKNFNKIDELINKYQSEGNNINDEIKFIELNKKVNSVFKSKGIFSIFK